MLTSAQREIRAADSDSPCSVVYASTAAHLAVEVGVVAVLEGGAAAAAARAALATRHPASPRPRQCGAFCCPLATPFRNLRAEFGDVQQVFEHVEHLKAKARIAKLTCISYSSATYRVVNIIIAGVAPDAEVGEAEAEAVVVARVEAVEEHVLVDIPAAVDLQALRIDIYAD